MINDDGIEFVKVSDDIGIENFCMLAETIWYEYFPSIISTDQIQYMLTKFLSVPAVKEQMKEGYEYYLCKLDREYVGFISFKPEQASENKNGRMFLSKLYLKQDIRSRGFASGLVHFVAKNADSSGLEKVYLTVNKFNSHAIDVYYHWGFRNIESVKTDIGGGFFMDDYVMEAETAELLSRKK